ncbi:MAG: MATE family efflux transporter [bacterium]|nr:MATE family efflux transporter [bacterium]
MVQYKNNLIEGSVLRSLITLSFPIILANLLQSAYHLTDTFWVGRLGPSAIAAVSISFPLIFLLISFGGGLNMAGSILVAQYKGKNNQKAINHIAGQTFLMVLVISLFLSVIGYIFAPFLIGLMGTAPSVFSDAVSYLRISFIGVIFLFTFFVFQFLMRGVGNVKLPMYIVLGTVLLNLLLDPLFIFGYKMIPAMGVSGAALVSVMTQGLSALVGILILFLGKNGIYIQLKSLRPDFSLIKKIFNLGLPASIEQSTRSLGLIALIFLVTSFGTVTLAAYGIATRMFGLAFIPAMGLSLATSTLVGQNMGAGKIERAEKTVKISLVVGFISLTMVGILMFIFAPEISAFFIPGEAETIESSSLFLRIIALTFGLVGIQQSLMGAFRGSGNTLASMFLSIFGLWMLRFPLAYILSKHTGLAEVGIWIAFPVSNIAAALVAALWFLKGTWKNKRITEEIKIAEKAVEETIIEEGLQ